MRRRGKSALVSFRLGARALDKRQWGWGSENRGFFSDIEKSLRNADLCG